MVSAYGIAAMICYLPSGIVADKFRMRTLAWVGFIATAVLVFVYAMLPSVQICLILFVLMGVTSILVWWGTRFKVIRPVLRGERVRLQDRHQLLHLRRHRPRHRLINAGIIAAISGSAGVQAMLIFLGVVIASWASSPSLSSPTSRARSTRTPSCSASRRPIQAIKHPGVIWACVAYFACYAVYQALPTPRRTSRSASTPTATS